jgi:hypothetical protein
MARNSARDDVRRQVNGFQTGFELLAPDLDQGVVWPLAGCDKDTRRPSQMMDVFPMAFCF